MGKRTMKDKPKEKFNGLVLRKSRQLRPRQTGTIQQPLKAVTGTLLHFRQAIISISTLNNSNGFTWWRPNGN